MGELARDFGRLVDFVDRIAGGLRLLVFATAFATDHLAHFVDPRRGAEAVLDKILYIEKYK